jgi:hypothetical protein
MSKTRTTITALCAAVILTGCGSLEKLITKTEYVVRPPITLPEPEPVNQLPLEWHVITTKNLEKKLKELQDIGGEVVVFALTPQGYQNLSMNAAELRRYIQSQNAYIKLLKQYYERPVQPAEKK